MQVFIRWQSFWKMQLATQYKGLILKWPYFVRKSFLNLYLSFLITTSLSPQISYLDSMWPLPLQPCCRRKLKDLSWGSDNVDVKRVTWKGRWTDPSFGPRALVDQRRNVPRDAGWTASKTSQPICCFHRRSFISAGSQADSFLFFTLGLTSTLYWIHVKVYIHNHVGHSCRWKDNQAAL